jgi:hypothetical protein
MKKKTLVWALAALGLVVLASSAQAGTVKTKDEPEKCGGYHDGQYHLKCKNEKTAKDGYVERKHKWKNPFSGFTKAEGHTKTKKQGSMPHSR